MLASALPPNPSLENLRKQAKEFRDGARTGYPKFTDIVRALLPRHQAEDWSRFTLAEAQLVVARWYGFASWHRLRIYLERVAHYQRAPHRQPVGPSADGFLQLACLSYRSALVKGTGPAADDRRRMERARALLAADASLGATSVYTAAATGDIATARAMLTADPDLANREGGPYRWPPLLYLMFSRVGGPATVEVAALLLAHGADPNAGYLSDGEPPPVTALSGAFHGERDPVNQPAHPDGLALARLLLDAGATPNDGHAVGNACGYPYDDAGLAILLPAGLGTARPDPWRDRLGLDPVDPAGLVQAELRTAAQRNLVNRVRLLIPHCSNVDAPDDSGRTAHQLATAAGNTDVAALLAAAGARIRPLSTVERFVAACLRADDVTVRAMLAADPDLVERAGGGWPTPLHQAAYLNRPDAVRLLVAVGFPVDDRQGWPLHTAAVCGHLDVVMTLVTLGTDPRAQLVDDTPGQFTVTDPTPLGWARYGDQRDVASYLATLP